MDAATIIAAFAMPPKEAVAFLTSKGLVVTGSWRELWQAAHARAFTVAQSAGYDVLGDIRNGIADGMNAGENWQTFAKKLTPILQAKGWWGKVIKEVDKNTGEVIKTAQLGSPRRLKLIYEQNVQTAFMAGRYRGMMAATKTHPYWQYVAVLDSRTRPSHKVMHGRVFSYNDVAWGVAYPPNGWLCRCRVSPLSKNSLVDDGLSLETAEGYVKEVEIQRRDGSKIKVKQLALPGLFKPFQPDAGWDYNPAIAYHKGNI